MAAKVHVAAATNIAVAEGGDGPITQSTAPGAGRAWIMIWRIAPTPKDSCPRKNAPIESDGHKRSRGKLCGSPLAHRQ
jgi:hypothetical protein